MGKVLTILHTGMTTVKVLGDAAKGIIPSEVTVRNVVDDSLLIDTRKAGFMTDDVANRIVSYVKLAEKHGSDCVLFACSSVGPAADLARREVNIPVLRIDEPMADAAAQMGPRVVIVATVSTTLKPTLNLIERAIEKAGTQVTLDTVFCDRAFDVLSSGDVAGHNRLLIGAIVESAAKYDTVVLAQASMANILPDLPSEIRNRVLTSPKSGLTRTAEVLQSLPD